MKLMNLLMVAFETFLNLKLNCLIILSALSLFGWYNLGWALVYCFISYRNSSLDDDDL
jgi:hypothetical protein